MPSSRLFLHCLIAVVCFGFGFAVGQHSHESDTPPADSPLTDERADGRPAVEDAGGRSVGGRSRREWAQLLSSHTEGHVRDKAVSELVALGLEALPLVDVAMTAFPSRKDSGRLSAVLYSMGPGTVPAITNALEQPGRSGQWRGLLVAIYHLKSKASESRDAVVSAYRAGLSIGGDRGAELMYRALDALVAIDARVPELEPHLRSHILDPSRPPARCRAADLIALAGVCSPETEMALVAMSTARGSTIRRAAVNALASCNAKSPDAAQAIQRAKSDGLRPYKVGGHRTIDWGD